jgi:hypothetical protein
MAADTTTHRFTITITPMTQSDLDIVIDDIRKRFGRKHLIHVIGKQSSGTHVSDAPRETAEEATR